MSEAKRLELISRFAALMEAELAGRGDRWRRRRLDGLAFEMSEHADELLFAARPSVGKPDVREVARLAIALAVDALTLEARMSPQSPTEAARGPGGRSATRRPGRRQPRDGAPSPAPTTRGPRRPPPP